MSDDDTLIVWTVFFDPLDYPGKWALRGFDVTTEGTCPHADVLVGDSLEEVRAGLPPGAYRLERNINDDPKIVENWL